MELSITSWCCGFFKFRAPTTICLCVWGQTSSFWLSVLEAFKVDWNSIFKVETTVAPTAKTVKDFLLKHKEVFAECGNPIKDFTFFCENSRSTHVTKSMFYKAQPVLLHWETRLNKNLKPLYTFGTEKRKKKKIYK